MISYGGYSLERTGCGGGCRLPMKTSSLCAAPHSAFRLSKHAFRWLGFRLGLGLGLGLRLGLGLALGLG